MEWTLSDDRTCFDADDVTVATQTAGYAPNVAAVQAPAGGYDIPLLMPLGTYWLCAGINPRGVLAETDPDDNWVISDRQVLVVP
ncbi:MAG: hypothetical protein R3F59_00260 [Myxococcota bacterium]